MKEARLVVGFAGLPGAGKSTVINALVGKRVLQSGVCRTTTHTTIVGPESSLACFRYTEGVGIVNESPVSTDGVAFCAVDLPGVSDTDEKSEVDRRVNIASGWARKCDVVAWVTDARTAFSTTHELRAFRSLWRSREEAEDESGCLYQLCIVMAKCEAGEAGEVDQREEGEAGEAGEAEREGEARGAESTVATSTEITGPEDTTVEDNVARVRKMFPNTRVEPLSAFGLIAHSSSPSASAALKALAGHAEKARNENTSLKRFERFDLEWAVKNLSDRRDAAMRRAKESALGKERGATIDLVERTLATCFSCASVSCVSFAGIGQALWTHIAALLTTPLYLLRLCAGCALCFSYANVSCITLADFGRSLWTHAGALLTTRGLSELVIFLSWTLAIFLVQLCAGCAPLVCRISDRCAFLYRSSAAWIGSTRSQAIVGAMYETGRGVEKNTEEALRFYKRASCRGDVDACYRAGLHGAKWSSDRACSYGCGCTFNDCMAHCETCHAAELACFPFLECAAERGHMGAQYWLGLMHEQSDVPPCVHSSERREELALEWYYRAAEQGHAGALSALGSRLYESGDYTRAETLLRNAADQGDASAAYRLRRMYEETPNAKWTVAWYIKAAEKGNAQAQFELGRMYHTGDRVPEDHARAAVWYRAAAKKNVQASAALDEMCNDPEEQGSSDVLFWLWRKYSKQDEGAAARWLTKAAEQGDAESQLLIGLQMIETDAANARVWLTRASDQGLALAEFMLGVMMAINLGGPGDAKIAEALMVKALQRDDRDVGLGLGADDAGLLRLPFGGPS